MPDLTVALGPLKLRNPVLVASGTYGYGQEYAELCEPAALGGLVTKTITLKPRSGNPPPRVVETPSGMLNSIGLENVGLEGFLRDKLPALRKLSTRVIVSIGGDTVREYAEIARRIDGIRGIDGLEVNISCPNVRRGGMAFGADPKITHRILSGVRRATSLPAIAKLTPNVTAIEPIARAAEDAGVDGLSLINTLQGLCIDTETRCSRLGGFTGGLSGPAIRPVAVAMVFRVHQAVKIPVIGIGGIMTPADALEFMIAGASAIQVGTGNFVDPRTPVRVVEGLTDYCRRHQIKRLRGIVGTLQSSRASCL